MQLLFNEQKILLFFMKKLVLFFLFILFSFQLNAKTEVDKAFRKRTKSTINKFILYSPDIYDNRQIRDEQVFNGFGCEGKNISPKLVWRNAPADTKSFAITMYDKDAKTGSGWWHWIVYNIPANVTLLETGASETRKLMPKGAIQSLNDFGTKKYGGVCPPAGSKHNYIITIYALNVEKLDLPKNVMPAMVGYYINKHKIASTAIKAFYKRNANIIYKEQNLSREKDKKIVYKGSTPAKKKKYSLNQGVSTQSKNQKKAAKNKKSNLDKNKTSKNKQYNLKSNNGKNSGTQKNVIVEEN